MSDLTELVDEINKAGWLVSGMHQVSKGQWTASLRKAGHFSTCYGYAPNPLDALQAAWDERNMKLDDGKERIERVRI